MQLYIQQFVYIRMNRLTLNNINNIQRPTNITSNLKLNQLFICDQNIYAVNQDCPHILMKYTIKNIALIDTIQIQLLKSMLGKQTYRIKSLAQIGEVVSFSVQSQNQKHQQKSNLLFYILNKQVKSIASHMAAINQVICFQKQYFLSCSQDLTVRVWKILQNKIIPNPQKHVLPYHKDAVTCLQKYQNCLISGSKDFTVAFWKNFQVLCSIVLNGKIIRIQICSQSEQIAVFIQNIQLKLEIHTISMIGVLKNKKPQITKTIKCNQIDFNFANNFILSSQIDDSFLVFVKSSRKQVSKKFNDTELIFVQVNLGKILSRFPKISQQKAQQENQLSDQSIQNGQVQQNLYKNGQNHSVWGQILDMKCLGRLILLGVKSQNILLLKT